MTKSQILPVLLTVALLAPGLAGSSMAQASGLDILPIQDIQETIAGRLNHVYDKSLELWYGENPYLNTPHVTATPDALQSGEGVFCYTGHHTPTIIRLHDELPFIGHTLDGFNSKHLYIHLSDGNLAQDVTALPGTLPSNVISGRTDSSPRSWCFRYQGSRDTALYDKIRGLGWLNRCNAITTVNEGDFHLRHSGSGRITVHDPAGYQQAARGVITANPAYVKEVYLLDGGAMAARISPNELISFAESGTGHLEMMSANNIVDDYYDRFYGFFKHTSPIGYGATTGLIFASLYAAELSVISSLALAPIGAFGAVVVAPHYLLPRETLETLSPIEVPVATLLAMGGHLFSTTGTAMEYGGSLVSAAGDSLHAYSQSSTVDGWSTLAAIATVGVTPQLLRFANWASFGYLNMAGRIFFGGALFAAGAGTGVYALLAATDWYKKDQTDS